MKKKLLVSWNPFPPDTYILTTQKSLGKRDLILFCCSWKLFAQSCLMGDFKRFISAFNELFVCSLLKPWQFLSSKPFQGLQWKMSVDFQNNFNLNFHENSISNQWFHHDSTKWNLNEYFIFTIHLKTQMKAFNSWKSFNYIFIL